jgi:hypothetical protein
MPGSEDFTVIEKRPESFRLNFADSGVVNNTLFTKGVITEFKKLTDGPYLVNVESLVKVKVDEVESDFIPLFYCPKKQYWDGTDADGNVIKAQDVDKEKKYHKRAWMSFRGGDEVKVAIREGVPQFVLGFLDGVPRVGENIIKWYIEDIDGGNPRTLYFQGNSGWIDYPDKETGPDGKKLDLTEEAIEICNVSAETIIPGPPLPFPLLEGIYIISSTEHAQYFEYLVELGGMAYIVQIRTGSFSSSNLQRLLIDPFAEPLVYDDKYTSSGPFLGGPQVNILAGPNNKKAIDDIKAMPHANKNDWFKIYPGFTSLGMETYFGLIFGSDQMSDAVTGKGIRNGASIQIHQLKRATATS